MSNISFQCCSNFLSAINDDSIPLVYIPKFREIGINYLDGGSSFQEIYFCPWCGKPFPGSLRDQWFEKIDLIKLEIGNDEIPIEMQTDMWWNDNK